MPWILYRDLLQREAGPSERKVLDGGHGCLRDGLQPPI